MPSPGPKIHYESEMKREIDIHQGYHLLKESNKTQHNKQQQQKKKKHLFNLRSVI